MKRKGKPNSRRVDALMREWGRLDALLPSARGKYRDTIKARKTRVGHLIVRAEKLL